MRIQTEIIESLFRIDFRNSIRLELTRKHAFAYSAQP
jgi:hypothetical protein